MSTTQQITAMQKLTETLARMDIPAERQLEEDADIISRAIDDAQALYDLIEHARDILKMKGGAHD